MMRQFFFKALTFGIAGSALILASCSTTETRISGHPEIYQTLSPGDQALVSQGQVRAGMSQGAVWLAWGSPDRKIVGNMRGRPTETWSYGNYTTYLTTVRVPTTVPVSATGSDIRASVSRRGAIIITAAVLLSSLVVPFTIRSIIRT